MKKTKRQLMKKTLLLLLPCMALLTGNAVHAQQVVTMNDDEVQQHKSRFADLKKTFATDEALPQFPGGDAALMSWLRDHLRYPKTAAQFGIEGRVVVVFVVGTDGKVSEVKVAKSVDNDLDQEAVRVCKMLPKFIPAHDKSGKPVAAWYTLPITFKLPPRQITPSGN
jgi:protein TonB